jgi:hypothetical protein
MRTAKDMKWGRIQHAGCQFDMPAQHHLTKAQLILNINLTLVKCDSQKRGRGLFEGSQILRGAYQINKLRKMKL